MSKCKRKQPAVNIAELKRVIQEGLDGDRPICWYPQDSNDVQIEEKTSAFRDGFKFALKAVWEALLGDKCKTLKFLLNRNAVLVCLPDDETIFDVKKEDGSIKMTFGTPEGADDFIRTFGLEDRLVEVSDAPDDQQKC